MLTGSGRPCYNAVTQGAINSLPHRWPADFSISFFFISRNFATFFSYIMCVCVCGRGVQQKREAHVTPFSAFVYDSAKSLTFFSLLHVFFPCVFKNDLTRVTPREWKWSHKNSSHEPSSTTTISLSLALSSSTTEKAPIWRRFYVIYIIEKFFLSLLGKIDKK